MLVFWAATPRELQVDISFLVEHNGYVFSAEDVGGMYLQVYTT